MKRPTVVCMCGSTKFKAEWEKAIKEETLAGKIALAVSFYTHADGYDIDPKVKSFLDELHLRKIDLASEILVINKDGYIGSSTTNEIAYAKLHRKKIRYLY